MYIYVCYASHSDSIVITTWFDISYLSTVLYVFLAFFSKCFHAPTIPLLPYYLLFCYFDINTCFFEYMKYLQKKNKNRTSNRGAREYPSVPITHGICMFYYILQTYSVI